MGIQGERKVLQTTLEQSHMLAKKARKEIRLTGTTEVFCPKCGEKPEISVTSRGERTMISCACGYIYDAEINL